MGGSRLSRSRPRILLLTGFAPLEVSRLDEMGSVIDPFLVLASVGKKNRFQLTIPTIGAVAVATYLRERGAEVEVKDFFLDDLAGFYGGGGASGGKGVTLGGEYIGHERSEEGGWEGYNVNVGVGPVPAEVHAVAGHTWVVFEDPEPREPEPKEPSVIDTGSNSGTGEYDWGYYWGWDWEYECDWDYYWEWDY
jgi:hypothetical protein